MHEDTTTQRSSWTLAKAVAAGAALTLAIAPTASAGNGNGQTPPGQAKKEAAPAPAPPAHAPAHGVRGTSPQAAPKAKKAKPAPKPQSKPKQQAAPAPQPQSAPAPPKQAREQSSPSRGNSAIAHERVTFCHATGSATNPFVEITTSRSAVIRAHDRHQDGRDIIPVPAGGCPSADSAVAAASLPGGEAPAPTLAEAPAVPGAPSVERVSDVLSLASSQTPAPAPEQGELPADDHGVLGATASSPEQADEVAPRGSVATLSRDSGLPFTGLELLVVIAAGVAALLGGFALHRATASRA